MGEQPGIPQRGTISRTLWLSAGLLCLAVGAIGIVVPLLPTVPIWILAAAAFARSSPRLEAWLLDHKQFGPAIRAWREQGVIPPRAKMAAVAGLVLGFSIFLATANPALPLAAAVGLAMALIAVWVVSRPSAG